jgi:hypothetical protein
VTLRAADEVDGALHRLEVARISERAEQLEPAPREVLGGGVEERAVIGERDVVQVEAVVVRVERRPAAVLVLHPEEPAHAALLGEPHAIGVEAADLLERHEDHGGVVEVRIEVVAVLEGPAARLHVRPLYAPVAGGEDLLAEHPLGGAHQRGVVGREVALDQRVGGQRGVPHRRGAGLVVELVAALDRERLDLLELSEHQRMVLGIAEQPQGED